MARIGSANNCICCACVEQGTLGIVTSCGAFQRFAEPGCVMVNCLCGEYVQGTMSMRVTQLNVQCETKTKDNVFVTVVVAVQYQVKRDDAYNAYYRLTDPSAQIRSYVFDVVRASIPKINLDDVFTTKEEIALAVKEELLKSMAGYGYEILQALVVDIEPDPKVKAAMNDINAAQRQRVATLDRAEAQKLEVVKAAEADAESKYLAGLGIARQRQAIVNGLRESVQAFQGEIHDATSKDVLDIMLMTQYFDMLQSVGSGSRATTIFLPHSPAGMSDVASQIRDGVMAANAAGGVAPAQQGMRR